MKGWAPIGVVAAIVPWNFPLMLLSWKVTILLYDDFFFYFSAMYVI